jgi:mono/diheme cytochrome c family protein
MPAFDGLLSAGELDDLLAFIESRHAGSSPAPEVLTLPELPPPGPEELREGRAIYLLQGCWTCHGLDGSGRGPAARALTDETGRPIRATDFRHDPLKGGREPEDVVRTLLTGLNGAPMPAYGEAMLFAREDVADPSTLAESLAQSEVVELRAYLDALPTRAELDARDAPSRSALRHARLAALARYVLSLDRRGGFWHELFHEQPEKEPRRR